MSYTTNAYRLKTFMDRIPSRLIDFVNLGDSNILRGGTGWDVGVTAMIFEYLNGWTWGPGSPSAMYATGLHAFGESGNGLDCSGSGMGWGLGSDGSTSQNIRHLSNGSKKTGALDGDEAFTNIAGFWHSGLDPGPTGSPSVKNPMKEVYWASTSVPEANAGGLIGLMLQPQNPIGIGKVTAGALQYQLWAAKWTSADAPNLDNVTFFSLRHPNGDGGGSLLNSHSFTTHGAATSTVDTEAPFTISISVDGARSDTDGLSVRWNDTAGAISSYPFAAFFQRFVRINATTGFSVSNLYSTGGADVWDCLNYVTNVQGNTPIRNYLKCVTKHQRDKGQQPMVVFPIMFGMNDWGGTPMTEANHKTYMLQLIAALRTAWTDNGYNPANVLFALVPSHMPDSGDSIAPYRRACAEIARAYSDVCCLDLNDVTSYATLNGNIGTGYPAFDSAGDKYHLRVTSITNDSYRMLGTLLADVVANAKRPATGLPLATKLQVAGVLFNGVV